MKSLTFNLVLVLLLLPCESRRASLLRQQQQQQQRRHWSWEEPEKVDDGYSSALDASIKALERPAPAPPPSADDTSLKNLLASAHWPDADTQDQVFNTATSGATTDPCAAPFLGRARLSPYGFGAHMNQFANEVSLALYAGKPIALCAPPDVRDTWAKYYQDPGFARCGTCDWDSGPRKYRQMGWDISNGHDHQRVAEIKHYLYGRLFTLQPEAQATVDAGLQSLGLGDGPYIGVHVRRGDKAAEVAPVPLQRYVAAVQQMCNSVGTNKVFLASDDETVHAQLQESLGSSFSVLEQQRLPEADYQLRGDASRSMVPPSGEEDEEKSLLIDVTGLVRAAGFIGTASSNVDKFVFFQRDPTASSVSLDEGGNDGFITLKGASFTELP